MWLTDKNKKCLNEMINDAIKNHEFANWRPATDSPKKTNIFNAYSGSSTAIENNRRQDRACTLCNFIDERLI